MLREPLAPADAKRLIRTILDTGAVRYPSYVKRRMAERALTLVDVREVLRGGVVEPAEWESGEWRYRVRVRDRYVVVAFEDETTLVLVTVWRKA